MTDADDLEISVHIAAQPETVFPYFTDPARYVQWMGSQADLEPVPGGCTNGVFTFQQPDAILTSNGKAQVLHTNGPIWTSVVDGSTVGGTTVATAPSPNAIAQLLLAGNKVRGPGLLADVTFIQRLDTTGGLAPTGACVEGTTASVPYTATYTFWVKA